MKNLSKEKPKGNYIFSLDEIFPEDEENFFNSFKKLTVISNDGLKLTSTNLSKNFFENLLILEMDLENEFSSDKLIELVKQYSIAIEYYLQIDPKMAKAYQNRMEYLLTNKDTLTKLKKQNDQTKNIINENNTLNINNNTDKNQEMNEKSQIKMNYTKKIDDIKIKQGDINFEDLSKKVELFLNKNNKTDENKISGKNIIYDELEKQNFNWKEKLKKKKKNPSRFSVKPNIGNSKKNYFGFSEDEKIPPNNPNDINDNSYNIDEVNNGNHENKKFNSVFEELYEIKEDDFTNEENKEKIEENEEIIKKNKIEDLNAEKNKEDKKDNKEKDNNNNYNKDEVIIISKEINNNQKLENIIEEKKFNYEKEEKEQNEKNEIEIEEVENMTQNRINPPMISNVNSSNNIKSIIPTINTLNEKLGKEMLEKVNPEQEITNFIESHILSLKNIITQLNSKNLSKNEEDVEEEEDSEFSNSNQNLIKLKNKNTNLIDQIPTKYQEIFTYIENFIHDYMNDFNKYFYKDIFEQFSSSLKELYEMKYKKYIEIRNEYHNQIKENEYLLEIEDNLTNEKKEEYQQTIESLNEEQQHQIGLIEDEFNKKIMDKISEFKRKSFKNNSGIQLLEEKVKLDIYSLINEAF